MARLSLLAALSAAVASATAAAVSPRQDAVAGTAAVVGRRSSGYSAPTAHLKNGSYYGVYNPTYHQDMFLGMPYAEPPVGDLRFRPPQPLGSGRSWEGRRNATEYSPLCFGYGSDTWVLGNRVSEDCLTINVVRPHGVKPDAKLPVALWIHGGSLTNGGSADPRYNMSFIVEQSIRMGTPMIAASINYRLHAWGFLWSDEVKRAGAGNLGFRDQRLALQWVQENIGAFRGDPDRVTLWSESAGSRSVAAQMLAYDGRDDKLYRGAILQSGTGFDTDFGEAPPPTSDAWQNHYDAVAAKVGCAGAADSLACLRAVPAWTLSDAINSTATPSFTTVVDGEFLTARRHKLLASGRFTRVPLLIGANFDEGTAFGKYGVDTEDQWHAYLAGAGAGNVTAEVLSALYPDVPRVGIPATLPGRPAADDRKKYGAMWKRASAFGGDRAQHGPRRLWARTWARAGLPAWSYHFNVLVGGVSPALGATHFQEVAFVFNNTRGLGYDTAVATNPFAGAPPTFGALADVMSRMWVGFVVAGDPNAHRGATGVRWPRYDDERPENMVFDVNATSLAYAEPDTYRTEQIEYLIKKLWS
ncbi:hypothetical protein RB601_006717 [Gaeumannomyces tritici]